MLNLLFMALCAAAPVSDSIRIMQTLAGLVGRWQCTGPAGRWDSSVGLDMVRHPGETIEERFFALDNPAATWLQSSIAMTRDGTVSRQSSLMYAKVTFTSQHSHFSDDGGPHAVATWNGTATVNEGGVWRDYPSRWFIHRMNEGCIRLRWAYQAKNSDAVVMLDVECRPEQRVEQRS